MAELTANDIGGMQIVEELPRGLDGRRERSANYYPR